MIQVEFMSYLHLDETNIKQNCESEHLWSNVEYEENKYCHFVIGIRNGYLITLEGFLHHKI